MQVSLVSLILLETAVGLGLRAGTPPMPPVPPRVATTNQARLVAPRPPSPPPQPPQAPSPIETFRQMVYASPAQREAMLAGRSQAQQETLQKWLREFDGLDPREKELRLRLLAVKYWLSPLLKASVDNRNSLLAQVPDSYRSVVLEQLQFWDRLPATTQRKALASGQVWAMLPVFLAARVAPPVIPPAPTRAQAQSKPSSQVAPAKRAQALRQLLRFYAMSEGQRQKVLQAVQDPQRRRLERLLVSFHRLSPAQRAQYLGNLRRFAGLSDNERQQFWLNAARWQTLPASARQAWRRFTAKLPPAPPVPNTHSRPVPPTPPPPLPR